MGATEEQFKAYLQGHAGKPVEVDPVRIGHVGYDRPLELAGVRFTGPVVFDTVTFSHPVDFTRCEFCGPVVFYNCLFTHALFTAARFRQAASFAWSAFNRAYFWRAQFSGPATLEEFKVRPAPDQDARESVFNGEANFSYATFAAPANFTRARLMGPAYFWGTRFLSDVRFAEMTFGGPLQFAHVDQITVMAEDFADAAAGRWPPGRHAGTRMMPHPPEADRDWSKHFFFRLIEQGVLKPSAEQGSEGRPLHAVQYADFPAGEDWETRLQQAGKFHEADLQVFASVRQALNLPMFPRARSNRFQRVRPAHVTAVDAQVNFSGAEFRPQEGPHFANVDLSRCLFRGATLGPLKFEDVTWDAQPMLFWTRPALHDEAAAATRSDFNRLRQAYAVLRSKYEATREIVEAECFHFGELEMRRRASAPLRVIHKYFNAYNTSLSLPIAWLLVFSCMVFPALYLAAGSVASLQDAILYTLFVSSFTKAAVQATPGPATHIVQALQLVTLSVILASIVLTFRRRYW